MNEIVGQNKVTMGEWAINFWAQGDAVNHTVLIILLLMSALSWTQIVLKSIHAASRPRTRRIIKLFWQEATIEKAINLLDKKLGKFHIFTNLARCALAGAHSFDNQKTSGLNKDFDRHEFISSALRQDVNESASLLESGMTILASVASVAPFVGLFGTVYGIYNALIDISKTGMANINSVAGPVGESLIMTAAGLFVAIPAVLAYNSFTRSNRLELVELDAFAHDLMSYLNIGTKLSSTNKK